MENLKPDGLAALDGAAPAAEALPAGAAPAAEAWLPAGLAAAEPAGGLAGAEAAAGEAELGLGAEADWVPPQALRAAARPRPVTCRKRRRE
jgi:hypothetical protein